MANIVPQQRSSGSLSSSRPAQNWSAPWDPFERMREFLSWDPFQEMSRRVREPSGSFLPSFDVREEKDAFVIKADLPGIQEKDVEISVGGNRLTISGKREEETTENASYYCCERSYGAFTRSFTLPDGVDSDKVQAEMRDGVLTLRIAKAAHAQPKRIAIKGASGNGNS
jgi:HSP20 family protein